MGLHNVCIASILYHLLCTDDAIVACWAYFVMAGPFIGELPSEGTEQKGQANIEGPPADKEPDEKRIHHIASPCPESGHVHFWQAESGRWFVGHTVSQEVAEVRLESGDISSRVTLEFDDEGFGCLMATGDDEAAPAFIKPLIDHFQILVFQKQNEGHPPRSLHCAWVGRGTATCISHRVVHTARHG